MVQRRTSVVLMAAALVVAAGVAAVTLLHPWRRAESPPAPTPDIVVVRTSADPGEVASIEEVTQLITGLPQRFAAGDNGMIATAARDQFPNVRTALPAGTVLTVDPATWRRTGVVASIAAVARVPEAPPTRFIVVLMLENESWRILSTTPLTDGP